MSKQFFKGYVQKFEGEEDGILSVSIASDQGEDRDGEVIAAEGWDFSNFLKNPVLLWAHDYRSEPIGKVTRIWKDGSKTMFSAQFAVNISDRARTIYRLYKEGFLNAFSVGFQPKEREGNIFTKVELLEISAVPVPANPRALVMARGIKGIESVELEKEIFSELKGVIGYEDHGIVSDVTHEWDATKELASVGENFEKLYDMSTWFDESNKDAKSSYKLPHHQAGDLKAVWRGVAAAMAALMGARGGVEVPEQDRKGIYSHLAKHYEEFGKKAPEFNLIEAQVLKDVDLDIDGNVIVHLVKVDDDEVKTLKADIEKLKSLAVDSGTEGSRGGGSVKGANASSEIVKNTKRILQSVDKAVGLALAELKEVGRK
jgi:HK97 family phage prohead protease